MLSRPARGRATSCVGVAVLLASTGCTKVDGTWTGRATLTVRGKDQAPRELPLPNESLTIETGGTLQKWFVVTVRGCKLNGLVDQAYSSSWRCTFTMPEGPPLDITVKNHGLSLRDRSPSFYFSGESGEGEISYLASGLERR